MPSRNLRSLYGDPGHLRQTEDRREEKEFHKDYQGIASPRACLLPWKLTTTLLY